MMRWSQGGLSGRLVLDDGTEMAVVLTEVSYQTNTIDVTALGDEFVQVMAAGPPEISFRGVAVGTGRRVETEPLPEELVQRVRRRAIRLT